MTRPIVFGAAAILLFALGDRREHAGRPERHPGHRLRSRREQGRQGELWRPARRREELRQAGANDDADPDFILQPVGQNPYT